MKKGSLFLKGISALALIFAVVLVGCQQPTEYTLTEKIHSLSAPSNLKATVVDGGVILQWNVVKDASRYIVLRMDTTTNVEMVLSTNTTTTYYADFVSWTNQMADTRKYEYSVISSSNYSTSGTAANDTIVQNGVAKVTATAKIPADITITLDPVTAETYTDLYGTDVVLVKIPYKPNYSYRVAYTYGTGAIVRDFEDFDTYVTGGSIFDTVKTVTFPAIGGNNSVTVEAWFAGGQNYYHKTDKKTTPVNVTLAAKLGDITFYATRQEKGVLLQWSNVDDATGYTIYKAQTSADASYGPTMDGITVISDWAAVTAAQENRGSYSIAFDPLTADTGYYIYAIIATGANNAKSVPAFATADPMTVTTPTLTISRQTTDTSKVQASWTADVDAVYELQYAAVKNSTDETQNATQWNFIATEAWKTASVTATNYTQGRAVVNINDLVVGKNYAFKLTASKNGVKGDTSVVMLTDNEFSVTVSFQLGVDSYPTNTGTNPIPVSATTIRLILSDNGTYRGRDYTGIKLYRRETTAGALGVYTELTLGAKSTYPRFNATTSPADSWFFDDTTADLAKTYQYKIVVGSYKIDTAYPSYGTEETGTNRRPVGYQNGSPSVYYNSYNTAATTVGTANFPANAVRIYDYNYLEGLKFTIRYNIDGTPAPTGTSEVTVVRVRDTTAGSVADYYYFVLPAAAIAGNVQLLRYPWSTTDIIGNTIFSKP
jgi:hypothetical protein